MLIFILVFVGTGLYFSYLGVEDAFYQLPPVTAILPGIACAWLCRRGDAQERMQALLEGMRHRDIVTMCVIFLLAGAFSTVTQQIGSAQATVNAALSLISPRFILTGVFLVTAFIATAIGTSMGAVATIMPVAVGLSDQIGVSVPLMAGTVIGGAMLGDNLSLISDTTIAAVMSQEADMRKKLVLNAKVACIAGCVTIVILITQVKSSSAVVYGDFSWWLISPYFVLMVLAISGMHVFSAISLSTIIAGVIGWFIHPEYSVIKFCQGIHHGFISMCPILLLSLLVGGLFGLVGPDMVKETTKKLTALLANNRSGKKLAQLVIAGAAGLLDILLANNTIAIILSGEMARSLAAKYRIPKHVSAAWLDISSCVFQGLIPYGGQVLLASTVAHISPLEVVPYVFYCYLLFFALLFCILRGK